MFGIEKNVCGFDEAFQLWSIGVQGDSDYYYKPSWCEKGLFSAAQVADVEVKYPALSTVTLLEMAPAQIEAYEKTGRSVTYNITITKLVDGWRVSYIDKHGRVNAEAPVDFKDENLAKALARAIINIRRLELKSI